MFIFHTPLATALVENKSKERLGRHIQDDNFLNLIFMSLVAHLFDITFEENTILNTLK